MRFSDTVYFDHAATSYPKPPEVMVALCEALEEAGGNPGRSGHALSLAAAEGIYDCRAAIAALFDAPSPERVVFTRGATEALNLAMRGLYRGGRILISDIEHNAVYRTAIALAGERVDIYPTDRDAAEAVAERITADTTLVVACHASNVFGRVLPIARIGEVCRARDVPFVVDAAQSAGHMPISVRRSHIEALCAPAHKGLLGIQGAGFVIFSEKIHPSPLMYGGTGTESRARGMPSELPERLEAGTPPTPAIFALRGGIAVVRERGVEAIGAHIADLEKHLRLSLAALPSLRLVAPDESGSGVISFCHRTLTAEEVAERLDAERIAVRAGLHCAPLAHRAAGTEQTGTVRVSLGLSNTLADCERLLEVLDSIL